jgi:hypothetical protein
MRAGSNTRARWRSTIELDATAGVRRANAAIDDDARRLDIALFADVLADLDQLASAVTAGAGRRLVTGLDARQLRRQRVASRAVMGGASAVLVLGSAAQPGEGPLVPPAHAPPVPDQQFETRATAIGEGVGTTVARGTTQGLLNLAREPIDAQAQIHRLDGQPRRLGADHRHTPFSQRPQASAADTGQLTSTTCAPTANPHAKVAHSRDHQGLDANRDQERCLIPTEQMGVEPVGQRH